MRILLVNDDGIYSDGIYALYDALKEEHEVVVVAPLFEQSAVSHSITLFKPLRIEKIKRKGEFFGWGVKGTPADCVKVAFSFISPDKKFDCIISGVNKGYNTATNILYSGTVSAASEGYLANIPSLAISTGFHSNYLSDIANFLRSFVLEWEKSDCFKEKLILNINYPDIDKKDIKGIRFTQQGNSFYKTVLEKRIDPMGEEYYWFLGEFIPDKRQISDDGALFENYISISPLKFDLTDYNALKNMKKNEELLWKKLKF